MSVDEALLETGHVVGEEVASWVCGCESTTSTGGIVDAEEEPRDSSFRRCIWRGRDAVFEEGGSLSLRGVEAGDAVDD